MAIWPYSRVRGGEKTCLLSSSWNDHFTLSDKRRPGPRGMWPRCSPAADHGCPGRETSAQTIFGSLPPATPLLQMALALGSKASSSPVVASHPHLLSSCWQQGAARTVYQLLTHNIRFTEAAWMCVADFLWPFPKEHRESKGILGSSNQHKHHLSPSQSWSAGNIRGSSHLDNQTLPGRLLCMHPDGSSLVLR